MSTIESDVTTTLQGSPCVVFVDADNTLWDTNGVYAKAQLALLEEVEKCVQRRVAAEDRLAWLRALDQGLAERHHARLRYPPRLLAKAAALRLSGHDEMTSLRLAWAGGQEIDQITEDDAARIERTFLAAAVQKPALRKGVELGLCRLRAAGCRVLIVTEGSRDRVLRLLDNHGLGGVAHRVIEARKDSSLFQRFVTLAGKHPHVFMIGDQLDRDIKPAKAAGLTTIYFPGGFRPKWHPLEGAPKPDGQVDDFNAAASIVLDTVARIKDLAPAEGCSN